MSRPLRIAVLYNSDFDAEASATDVLSVEASARAVTGALAESGHQVELIGLDGLEVLGVIDGVRAAAPDIVFNLCESMAGDSRNEPTFVGLLELFGIPYTGADLLALASCLHKRRAKDILIARGVSVHGFALDVDTPTAAWRAIRPCGLDVPQISLARARGAPIAVDEVAQELGPRVARAV